METWRVDGSAIEIPTREIYRYMGYRDVQPEDVVAARVAACTAQLAARSTPRSVWTSYPYTSEDAVPAASGETTAGADTTEGKNSGTAVTDAASTATPITQSKSAPGTTTRLHVGPVSFESRNLGRNLCACSHVVMMAATIGPGVDFLIRRAEATSMVDAAIYQAAGAAMVEAWCDMVNERIKEDMREQGLYARPRFSPGYGDVPLALQREFSQVLNLPKNCGISLTDTLLMTPSKSVTAFIGFSPNGDRCPLAGCEVCGKYATCNYHR